jgi:hypothetical protein
VSSYLEESSTESSIERNVVIIGVEPGNEHRRKFRISLVVLAGVVTAIVWDLHGSAEVAIATSALVLQIVEMTRDPM